MAFYDNEVQNDASVEVGEGSRGEKRKEEGGRREERRQRRDTPLA